MKINERIDINSLDMHAYRGCLYLSSRECQWRNRIGSCATLVIKIGGRLALRAYDVETRLPDENRPDAASGETDASLPRGDPIRGTHDGCTAATGDLGSDCTASHPFCPRCRSGSSRVHSRYQRTVADLPWASINVCLHLEVRKCFCLDPACTQRIFSEHLPSVVAPWARRTQRLAEQQRAIGLALGGVPSQRLSEQLDCSASRDTFLRLVRAAPTTEMPVQRYVSVDDWVLRKGQNYGSIVIDLERSVILDILPDRSAETFARWLQEHPGVEVISRDRSGTYADGATMGAPEAIQVVDRWHLLKNLGDALASLFDQHRATIEQHLRPSANVSEAAQDIDFSLASCTGTPIPEQDNMAGTSTMVAQSHESPTPPAKPQVSRRQLEQQARRRERRLARYEQVCQLRQQGWTLSAIADQIGMDRTTVRKYVQAADFPERQPRAPRASRLDPFKPYILQRWNAGCHIGAILLREIEQQGYRGGTSICHASGLPSKKRCGTQAQAVTDTLRTPSSRGLVWLVLRRPETLDEDN
jgi:transposase